MNYYPGITIAYHNDGSIYYRASVTHNRKHISLGSYPTPETGSRAYEEARTILADPLISVSHYNSMMALSFSKFISDQSPMQRNLYKNTDFPISGLFFILSGAGSCIKIRPG
jgi:hypothetical protein